LPSWSFILSKVYFIGRYALNYESSWVPAVTVTTLLLAPCTLFSIFILLLASGIGN